METTRFKTVLVVVITVLLAGLPVFAEVDGPDGAAGFGPRGGYGGRRMGRGPGGSGPGPGPGIEHILRRLDLTEQQIGQVREILESGKESAEAGRKAVSEAREKLHELVVAGAKETDIRNAAASLGAAIGSQAVSRAGAMASIRKVLTDEQLAELEELRANRGKGGRGFGRGMKGRRGRQGFAGRGGPGYGKRGHGRGRMGPGGKGPNVDRLFERFDSDQDGALTREELEAFGERMGGRPGGRW